MRIEVVPCEVRCEVRFHMTLSQAEAVGLYWALSDVAGAASGREDHPRLEPMYTLFDALYSAGAAEMSREPE